MLDSSFDTVNKIQNVLNFMIEYIKMVLVIN